MLCLLAILLTSLRSSIPLLARLYPCRFRLNGDSRIKPARSKDLHPCPQGKLSEFSEASGPQPRSGPSATRLPRPLFFLGRGGARVWDSWRPRSSTMSAGCWRSRGPSPGSAAAIPSSTCSVWPICTWYAFFALIRPAPPIPSSRPRHFTEWPLHSILLRN